MVIAQPVLQWQSVEKRAMHFIAVQNVIRWRHDCIDALTIAGEEASH